MHFTLGDGLWPWMGQSKTWGGQFSRLLTTLAYMRISKGCFDILNNPTFWKEHALVLWTQKTVGNKAVDFPYHHVVHVDYMRMTFDLYKRNCWHLNVCGTFESLYKGGWTIDHETRRTCMGEGCNRPTMWRCLSDGCFFVGCSRTEGQHALKHSETLHHPISVSASWRAWCYECNLYLPDKQYAHLKDLKTGQKPPSKFIVDDKNWCSIQ